MYKKLIAGLIMIMSPLYSMEEIEPEATGAMKVLTQDIARKQLQLWLTFQDISRLKRLSQYYNQLYTLECSHCREDKCLTYACNHCAKSYYQCTKMLVYFALQKNEQMFKHLWFHHRDIRKSDVATHIKRDKQKKERLIKVKKSRRRGLDITIEEKMRCYSDCYSRLTNIHRHICRQVTKAISAGDVKLANTILSGSGLSLFDVCKDEIILDCAFVQACELNNVDLIKNICGGCVDDRSFGYVIFYADDQLLYDLIKKDILPPDSTTKDGKKSVLHYAAEFGLDDVARIALKKGAYVNSRDLFQKTPLHYATKKENLGAVRELLKSPDADVRLKDKKGKTAIDYNAPQLKHLLHVPKRTDDRKEIARLLRDQKDQHQVSGYSHSKVHPNGYQELL